MAQTATNPQTGEKVVLQDGQWVPMAAPRAESTPRRSPTPMAGDPRASILAAAGGARATSGYRDPAHNAKVGGVQNSYHTRGTGQALDLVPAAGETMAELRARLASSGLPLVENINEGDHVHVAWDGPGLGDALEPPEAASSPAVQTATNPQTGEKMQLVDGIWAPVSEAPIDIPDDGYRADPSSGAITVEQIDPNKGEGYDLALARANERQDLLEGAGVRYGAAEETTGFLSDEMAGAAGFGQQGIENLLRRLRGEDIQISAMDAARAESDAIKGQRREFQDAHPFQAAAGGVLGGFAFAPTRAAGLLGSIGQAGAIGSGIGVAEGDGLKGRLLGGAAGGALGAGLAGGIGVAPSLLARTGSGVAEAASRVARGFGVAPAEAAITPRATRAAEQYVAGLVGGSGADITANPAGLLGKPITAAEAIGPNGVSQVAALARRSGRTGLLAQDQLGARAAETQQRVVQDFADLTGVDPAGSADVIANLADRGRKAATPFYEAAYARPGAVRSPLLDSLMERPSVRRALGNAVNIAREEGRDPTTLGFVFDEAGDVLHVREPSMQTLDYVKRGLDDVLDGYRDPTTRRLNLDTQGRAVVGTTKALRDEMIRLNPAYGEALQAGGDPIRLEAAFNDAPKLFAQAMDERTFSRRIASMGENERGAVVAGLADKLFNDAQAGRLRPRALRIPAYQNKLSALMGPENAASFMQRIDAEIAMAAQGGRMAPGSNSITGEVTQAIREQDQGVGLFADLARNIEQSGPIGGATRTALSAVSAPVAGFVRGFQAPAGQPVRDEIGRLLLGTPDDLLSMLSRAPARRSGLLGTGAIATGQNEARGLLSAQR